MTSNSPTGDFEYFLPFSASGQILGGLSFESNHALDVVLAHRRRTNEEGVVAKYRYNSLTDVSDWIETDRRSENYSKLR